MLALSLRSRLLLALTLAPSVATAQDADPTLTQKAPNVLLIVDSSGSMEHVSGQDRFPTCNPSVAGVSERSRWTDLVEVLTGTITDFRCQSIDRTSSSFLSEYRFPGAIPPPDYRYRNPYHRPLSGTCAPRPDTDTLSGLSNAFTFVSPNYSHYSTGVGCDFNQAGDGLIDSLGDLIRFGLMTFDTLPDARTGYNSGGGYAPSWSQGVRGAFSYYYNTPALGRPQLCLTPKEELEVGVRNGAAPAWEGKMIHFGDPNAGATYNNTRNTNLESVLLSTRPYGATPIAGALSDARDFLTRDDTTDPTDAALKFGPLGDEFVQGGCREQYIILLTDGEPNLDLRPFCEDGTTDDNCPYDDSPDIARSLKDANIPVYVVGMVPDTTSGGFDCTTLDVNSYSAGGDCVNPANDEIAACCALTQIAYEGGTEKAFFASDKEALRTEINKVFGDIVGGTARSATQPVRSPAVSFADDSGSKAYRFLSSYYPTGDGLWRGKLERLRWTCEGNPEDGPGVATEQPKDADRGDDFTFNVNKNPTDRLFITYVPDESGGTRPMTQSIRPNARNGISDGVGEHKNSTSTLYSGAPAAFAAGLVPEALMPDTTSGPCKDMTVADCRALLAPWYVGLDNGTDNHRCSTPASTSDDVTCSVIGDIMHSTPVIVNRPSAAVEDETYAAFAVENLSRPMMLYTASNDGVLHGFYVSPNTENDADSDFTEAVTTSASNEVFAFVPPAILPTIQSQYPSSRQKVLDGFSVVQDVVATKSAAVGTYYRYTLDRAASAFSGDALTWRTVLLQSFGGSTAGFYALDITEPDEPIFLWQLLTDEDGGNLFGARGATPLITTLNIEGDEVAVAVLPGGYGSPAVGSCSRADVASPSIPGFTPRSQVRCYNLDKNNDGESTGDDTTYIGARSLTVVRLDSGEIIRSFRRSEEEAPSLKNATGGYAGMSTGLVTRTSLDSPITGTPVGYPAGPGAISDRIFVGDQDGTLWKVNVASDDPDDWSMTLFFDAYAKHPGTPVAAAQAGHPLITAPVLSVDDLGQVTVAFSTGDQDLSGGPSDINYLWSLRETVSTDGSAFEPSVNWYEPYTNGKRVLGPMVMLGGVLYFATFEPNSGTACDEGTGLSSIHGVHYTRPADAEDLSKGGEGQLSIYDEETGPPADPSNLPSNQTANDLGIAERDTLIFGVTLEYVPSCYETASPAATWLGTHAGVSNMSSPQLQLTFQTSTTSTTKEDLGFETGFESVTLTPPRNTATIEAWAPVLE